MPTERTREVHTAALTAALTAAHNEAHNAESVRTLRPSLCRRMSTLTLLTAFVAFALACGTDAPAADDRMRSDTPLTVRPRTPVYRADIVRSYPHDTAAFTQGLLWLDGQMYESTGQVGRSNIRRVNLQTGSVEQQIDLPAPHFGEGITVLGDKLYQLTWQSGKAFVYDKNSFTLQREFSYEGEGWGLTTLGNELIMSDGSATLRVLDPGTFDVRRRVMVTENGTPVKDLNELEIVKGELWANVWTKDRIARIDPESGAVLGWIDLAGLLPQNMKTGREDVLNGIAYDSATDRIFVTGKYWPRLFEITLRLQR